MKQIDAGSIKNTEKHHYLSVLSTNHGKDKKDA